MKSGRVYELRGQKSEASMPPSSLPAWIELYACESALSRVSSLSIPLGIAPLPQREKI
jgi:hypothetical protein